MIRNGLRKLRWLIFLFVLSACSTVTKPDLPRLYQQSWQVSQPPEVLASMPSVYQTFPHALLSLDPQT